MTWLLLRVVAIGGEAVTELNPDDVADNLRARTRQTQARVLTRTLYVVILLIGVALALMTIPGVRQIGPSLLASDGLGALAIGLAAKPVLGNMMAGMPRAPAPRLPSDGVVVRDNYKGSEKGQ